MFMYAQCNTASFSKAFDDSIINEAERTRMFMAISEYESQSFVAMYCSI